MFLSVLRNQQIGGGFLVFTVNQMRVNGLFFGSFCVTCISNQYILGYVRGTINEILAHSKKDGGSMRPEWQIRNFRECLTSCELHDLGFYGSIFTWFNNQPAPFTVRERLDRACANSAWSLVFPEATVSHGASPYSDHLPVVITLCPEVRRDPSGGRKCFRFEVAWLQDQACEDIVRRTWTSPGTVRPAIPLRDKIAGVSAYLAGWGRLFGREVKDRIETLEKALMAYQQAAMTEECTTRRARNKEELTRLILQEETFWK
ncbi:UNVERIFIED_CONTAM: hypothetical protein Slati_3730000 [Sesamum latifolium]|uniref:Endonuclease/exonuclease/phosphatase domain-containing protein n=1 Tax=Sesamum latifolium TaxID=2727402 RepID=A0AAW2U325_9LAMI